MINIIKTNIQNHYYSYTPGEFLPVFVEGQWANRKEFTEYKLHKLMAAAGNKIVRVVEAWDAKVKQLHEIK